MSENNGAFSPNNCHDRLFRERTPLLRYNEERDFEAWRAEVGAKLKELIGDLPERVPINVRVEWTKENEEFKEYRFVYDSELDTSVPAHLLVPHKAKKPCPVVICLQGHSTGMHISLARPIYENDIDSISGGDRDFALQIVKEGYAALVIEQRAFGERISERTLYRNPHYRTTCHLPSMAAILLGRTMVGERTWDISRAIDAMEEFPEIDVERVACMGNSGGGTATYYAACLDERIKIAMPSCAVCTYRDSIIDLHHCVCNYVPNIARYFDMGDLAVMIAPKKLVVVCGENDPIFPLFGVKETFDIIKTLYTACSMPDSCSLVIGKGGHRFYADDGWREMKKLLNS